jgi:nucleolar protein 56
MTDEDPQASGLDRRTVLGLAAGASTVLAGCADLGADPALEVPDSTRIDEPVDVVATGLPADSAVRVEASVRHPRDVEPWTASATVRTGDDGRLDLRESAPERGAYESADPMGLFWAMEPSDVSRREAFFPLETHDVTFAVRPPADQSTDDGATDAGTTSDSTADELATKTVVPDDALATATTTRRLPEPRTESLDDGLVGTVHYPGTDGTAPAVVLLHGSGANEMTRTARLLADHGYVAASVQYFGNPDPLPENLVEVPVEYVDRVVARLRDDDRVSDIPVGLYGVSKGGEFALLAGAHLDDVGAVVSVAGSGVAWEGIGENSARPETSSWLLDGDPVPYVPYPNLYPGSVYEYYEDGFDEASEATVSDAIIPVEDVDGPVLLVSGDADGLWNSVRFHEIAADRRRENDAPVAHERYEDAGHSVSPPFKPTYGRSDGYYDYGGTPAGNARAHREYWPSTLATLATLDDGVSN